MKITCAKLTGGPRRPKPWHTFDVSRADTATRLQSITVWRHHWGATSQLPSLAALGNKCTFGDSFGTILIISALCNVLTRYTCRSFIEKRWDREGNGFDAGKKSFCRFCMEENVLVSSLSSPYSFRLLSRGWPFVWLVSTRPNLVQRCGTGCNTSWGTWAMMPGRVLIR